MSLLDEVVATLRGMPEKERVAFIDEIERGTAGLPWLPNAGAQAEAYLSKADVLLFGGRAGGGKSQLALGIGVNDAQTGIIFRRELSQTDGLERDGKIIIGNTASFNGTDLEWTWADGKSLKLGGMKAPDDWMGHAGRERDYMAFDEGGEFLEAQVASILAWLRAAPGKRTRAVIGSNPPRTREGWWLIKWFGPWLDRTHALYPTPPGLLRWAIYVADGEDSQMIWVDGPGVHTHNGEEYTAKSYTFIPASLEDNHFRNTPEYRAQLQSLPEPLRSQLLYGDFWAGQKDAANQAIPSAWVLAAIARWTPKPPKGVPMCCIGVDCSGGGEDPMVQAIRHDAWFASLVKTPGHEIPAEKAGSHAAGLVLANRRDGALIVVDLGGGYGGPLYEHLKDNLDADAAYGPFVVGFKGAEGTERRSRDAKLRFVNKRSAAYWTFREGLDPDQPGGSPIALPDDPRLIAGLTAATFEVTPNGIKIEPKVVRDKNGKVIGGVRHKLGFSPDESDATVMSWFEGPRETTHGLEWADMNSGEHGRRRRRRPEVITSRQPYTARNRSK